MKPYIYGKRNLIHIIDLKETVRGLLRATKFFQRVAASGGLILFVGTKRQAADTIIEQCARSGMPSVTERWLGGTLTNFRTIRSRLDRLEELETLLNSEQALSYSKKMIATLNRERKKIDRNLSGIRYMNRLPEALFVVDPHREKIAVSEARKLGIKIVALMDTDCDPDEVDLPIPGNDDSMRSIELVVRRLTDAILEGKAALPQEGERPEEAEAQAGRLERRRGKPDEPPTRQDLYPQVAPLGTEPQAGLKDEPPEIPDEVQTTAPPVAPTHPGSEGQTDLAPSSAPPETTLQPDRLAGSSQPVESSEAEENPPPTF